MESSQNFNQLQQQIGSLVLKRAPKMVYLLQRIKLPYVQLGTANFSTQLDDVPLPGDVLRRGTLDVTFKVDEDMNNYLEIYNWMIGLAAPESYDQYADLAAAGGRVGGDGILSDLTVMLSNSAYNPNIEFTFMDAWPTALSEIDFETTNKDVGYVDASVSFVFRHFKKTN